MAPLAVGKPDSSRRNLLDDSDSDSDNGGARVADSGFKVNEEYARRFEYNKKREERQKLEEKFKSDPKRSGGDDDESSSSNETEDEDGFLATEDLDAQISATLQAIRNKDPRLYDKDYNFIELPEDDAAGKEKKDKKDKPVFLRDYHREKFMRGDAGASDEEDAAAPPTYNEEQEALKKSIVSEINAAKDDDDSEDSDDDGFMKKKEPAKTNANGVHPSRAATIKVSELDVESADKDPETYLSNFLAARAWIPEEGGRWKAFESDDGEDDDRAEEFEQAYNMRFEDPEKSNEVLKSYARDFAAARSVRREEKTGRQRLRELEKEKEEDKRQRKEEKARLRKLKLEETEQKLRKVKQAAGAVGKELTEEEWMTFLDDAWENDKWEEEMAKRFGDDYYAMEDDAAASDADEADSGKNNKKHPKKPKWDDDIDIKDLVPDFEDEETTKPGIALSDEENQAGEDNEDEDADDRPSKKRKTADHKRERLETQKKARQERSKLEALVDAKLELTNHDLLSKNSSDVAFRYRETSPQSFGMTARDILLAPSDKALNEFAGLKKLASFRDPEKKRRDKKRLGKKARLREWRRGTFGREFEREGPTYGFEHLADDEDMAEVHPEMRTGKSSQKEEGNVIGDVGDSKKKKRKRSKGNKAKVEAE